MSHHWGGAFLLKIGEDGYHRENWIMISPLVKIEFERGRYLLETICESIAQGYLEKSRVWEANSRAIAMLQSKFEDSDCSLLLDSECKVVECTPSVRKIFYELFPCEFVGNTLPKPFESVLCSLLKRGPSKCSDFSDFTTRSFQVLHRCFVLLIKKSHIEGMTKVVIMEDISQSMRIQKARRIMTTRQFEAYVHYENGADNSELLADALHISKRTAERYHANIVYLKRKQLFDVV